MEAFLRGAGLLDAVSGGLQELDEELPDLWVVVDDENPAAPESDETKDGFRSMPSDCNLPLRGEPPHLPRCEYNAANAILIEGVFSRRGACSALH